MAARKNKNPEPPAPKRSKFVRDRRNEPEPAPDRDNRKIVRTQSAGVFLGEIVSKNGQEVLMKNARRLWYWAGAASLSQLAMEGVKNPSSCKFPCEVGEVLLLQAIEILGVTQAASDSVDGVEIWEAE